MARITVEDCLKQIGNENRFALIHLAVKRVKQHRKGAPFLVKCKNKETVSTLREIASNRVSFGNIQEYDNLPEMKAPAETKELSAEAFDDSAN
jgi:DNA-directed RNA polymerase subunit omega